MDAVKFIKEWKRICNKTDCVSCPLSVKNNESEMPCNMFMQNFPKKAIELVEKWSAEHPQKTRLKDLFEKYPNVQLEENSGMPKTCAMDLGYCKNCPKSMDCEECWNMPVEVEE